MKLKFTKMHGAGNDFIVINALDQPVELEAGQWREMADRRFGIGADQILIVEQPTEPGTDFRYRIFNSDGGEVEQCGNGARAFARYVTDKGLTARNPIRVQTLAGVIELQLEADGMVTVNMGAPVLEPEQIPFEPFGLQNEAAGQTTRWSLPVNARSGKKNIWIAAVSMGNPHAVQIVSSIATAPVSEDGPLIQQHARFPNGVNAGFMEIVAPGRIRLRVYERGAGETLACGTGACAAVVTGILQGLLTSPVEVELPGGTLTIAWEGGQNPVMMTGPAVSVFDGEIEIHS